MADEQTKFEETRKHLQQLDVEKAVKDRLVDFLTFNAYHLPMYTRPGLW
jgi:hypothetical protein